MTRAPAAALAAALALAACKKADPPPGEAEETPPAQVTCVPARAEDVADTVALRGAVAPPPLAEAVVASTVPGRITKLTVQEGDVVAAHALIAVIEDPTLGASAAESSADVAGAQAELRGATAERTRREKLVAQGIAPQKELDEARAREDAARAGLAAAQARSKLARGQLSRTELRAPRGGTVLRVTRRVGEVVDGADAAIAEIADLSVLELRAQVTGPELIGVVPHTACTVTLDALPGVAIPGEVVAVSPAIDPATALGTVRVALTLPPGVRPAIGLTGVAAVGRAPRRALVVPTAAVRRSLEGRDEVLVCAGDHVEVRAVELGARAGADRVELRGGLVAGDRVVVDHVLGLEDGQPIAPAEPK